MPIDCGVPQGFKLGPILYLIYANEIINALQEYTTFAYADDTAIVVSVRNCGGDRERINYLKI